MALEEAGTVNDPYLIENETDWSEIESNDLSDGSKYFLVGNSFTFSSPPTNIVNFYGDLDLGGNTLTMTSFSSFNRLITNVFGNIHNGEFNATVSATDGSNQTFFLELESTATISAKFTGSVSTNSTGTVSVVDILKSSGISDCIFDIDFTTVDGECSIINTSQVVYMSRCINTGLMQATGAGTAYPFTSDADLRLISCYYDSTINTSVTELNREKSATTIELQDIGSYTDETNILYGWERAEAVDATAGTSILNGSFFDSGVFIGIDFTINPGDNFRIGNDANREVVTVQSVDSSTQITIEGTFANNHSSDVWTQFVPQGVFSMATLQNYVDEDWGIDDGNAYPILAYAVEPASFASGTITLSGVAQANAIVDIISCPTVSEGTKTIVEQVTANGSGVYTATVERNTALNYWAEPRHYVEEFTGTLTPVSGTTFSTGVDLTGVSIGGANDPLYVLKSTGGTASGNEVVVESRSGNDITLSYDPGFDGTTTFSLGKAYGTNTVLARSSVS